MGTLIDTHQTLIQTAGANGEGIFSLPGNSETLGTALRSLKPVPTILSPCPVKLPKNWTALVNRPQREAEEQAVRHSVLRGTPFGGERWTAATAARLNLESTLRPRGRPRKNQSK